MYVHRAVTKDIHCGPYYCEVTCLSNPAVNSGWSKTARIEFAADNEGTKPAAASETSAQRMQTKGKEDASPCMLIHTCPVVSVVQCTVASVCHNVNVMLFFLLFVNYLIHVRTVGEEVFRIKSEERYGTNL